jgi:L-tartrate/succinate antiporter
VPGWKTTLPLLVWLILALVPRPAGLSPAAWQYQALFVAVIVALVFEPIPPSQVGLLGVTLAMVLGLVSRDPEEAIRWGLRGFADTAVWLIFGALVFSTGYEKTGLGRRIALNLVRLLGKTTLGLGYAVMLADLILAPFTPSNTGRSAGIIFPIVRGIPPLYGSAPGATARRIGSYLMWVAFASTTVTSSMFLTALAPNLQAHEVILQITKSEISWMQWMLGFLPVGCLLLALLPWLVYRIYPPEIHESAEVPAWAAGELRALGRLTRKEATMGILIVTAVLLWMLAARWINPTTVVLLAISLMLLTRVVEWADLIGNARSWDTLIYFATLLTLAQGLERVGIVKWLSGQVASWLTGYQPLVIMVALVVFFFLIHYLFASLTAHTVAVLPTVLAAGLAVPGMPVRTLTLLLAYSIGLMGVISPYATGPAAVYYSSGFIARKDFWRLGFVFGLIFLATLLTVGIPYLLSLGAAFAE